MQVLPEFWQINNGFCITMHCIGIFWPCVWFHIIHRELILCEGIEPFIKLKWHIKDYDLQHPSTWDSSILWNVLVWWSNLPIIRRISNIQLVGTLKPGDIWQITWERLYILMKLKNITVCKIIQPINEQACRCSMQSVPKKLSLRITKSQVDVYHPFWIAI